LRIFRKPEIAAALASKNLGYIVIHHCDDVASALEAGSKGTGRDCLYEIENPRLGVEPAA
jgi:hypothetical protein